MRGVFAGLLGIALAAPCVGAEEVRSNAPAELSAAATDGTEELLFHRGSAAYAAGHYAEAHETLQRFAGEYPQSRRRTTALLGCGWSLVKLQRLSEARQCFAPLVSDTTVGPQARRWLAWLDATEAERQGVACPIRTLAPRSTARDPAVERLAQTAWDELHAGRLAEAEAAFAQVLLAQPEPEVAAEAALVRGYLLEQLQRADAALAMYDAVLNRHQDTSRYAEALWAAARLRDELEQDQQALALYERLARECPQFAPRDALLDHQAGVLGDLGRPEEARALYEQLVRDFPQSPYGADAGFRLAQRAFEVNRYAEADAQLETVLQRTTDPRLLGNASYLRGQVAAAQQRWPEARTAFAAVTGHDPESPLRLKSEYGVAEALFRQGQYAEAAAAFEALVRQCPAGREPWMARFPLRQAQALGHQQRWAEAFAVAAQIPSASLSEDVRFETDYLVGRCLAQQAAYQEAREAYRRVLHAPAAAGSETAAQAQLMLGESYVLQKDFAAALGEFLRTEQDYPFPIWQAAALWQAAQCQERLGQAAEAVQLYRRLLDRYPQSALCDAAQAQLARLQPPASSPSSETP